MHAGPVTGENATHEALRWRRSTKCESSNCAEVVRIADTTLLRNSMRPEDVLVFSREQWAAFMASLRDEDR